jgi:hypothetical protein
MIELMMHTLSMMLNKMMRPMFMRSSTKLRFSGGLLAFIINLLSAPAYTTMPYTHLVLRRVQP